MNTASQITDFYSSRTWVRLSLLCLAFALQACGSGSGTPVRENIDPGTNNPNQPRYQGPAPKTDDIQAFRLAVWNPLAMENRCGSCHGAGGQEPTFVRDDDINLAYTAANTVVDLTAPANSRLVTKVAEGHQCWLASAEACATIVAGYIEAWAAASGSIATTITFEAPPDREVGASKVFPGEPGDFATTVYPLLETHCSSCHAPTAQTRQQPYVGSASVSQAYDASRSRMRLDDPSASRLVRRLADDGHNCWGDDCAASAAAMTAAIQNFADSIPQTEVDPDLVISRALTLGDGIVASSGGRVDTHVIAKYEFQTREGHIAYDTSGIEPAANLELSGDYSWMSSWGIRLNSDGRNGKAQASTSGSGKLHQLITGTGEYSVEAWVIPDNVVQGDGGGDTARIVSYSGSANTRNFTLGQSMYNYDMLNRSGATNANGLPAMSTNDADERLQATLQHVVVTFDPVNGRRIYVNGEFTGDEDPFAGEPLTDWDETFALVLGNEVTSNSPWRGAIRFLAVHNRALSAEAIAANFEVGVGARFYLLFNISELIQVPGAYVVFEAQQFDDYSYLFAEPFFLTLEAQEVPPTPLEGLRIGVNGSEVAVSQAFANLNLSLDSSAFEDGRQALSNLGTLVEIQQGAENDQFFLTFDRLGAHEYARVVAGPAGECSVEPAPDECFVDIEGQAYIGLRTFAQINATLSALTRVPHTTTSVANTYRNVREQMPSAPGLEGFLTAHQMGITQLSVSYCNALVEDSSLRASYFPGFDFSAPANSAFDAQGREQIIEPLLSHLLAGEIEGEALANQAEPAAVRAELNSLIDIMTDCGSHCGTQRTALTVKAACAAVMGSAVMLLQ
ncbi:LamG domain-containing protein [Marinimicrobium sp. ABcell2]|uniref:LamG domain-containing protein n=1 Tax=Marinimicrobium sp. ABcell2 TaxID=3069751 RepID=UPI0027B01111|nr:LamG domain-containing protein [Marinimicrobium sp. ABcell2]MDQ2076627.1 LamG domain-containing protein [Marinimicrobium sp. ABcell2]